MLDYDNNNHQIGMRERLYYGFLAWVTGWICDIPAAGLLITKFEKLSWLSITMLILIILMIPMALCIVAACNAAKLQRFFQSPFWRRVLRFGLGVAGVAALLFSIVLFLNGHVIFALICVFISLWMLWTTFRGTDEDVSDFWDH